MKPEDLAKEAERLGKDPVFRHALAMMRADAVERLCKADPADMQEIIRWQNMVAVVDEIPSTLEQFIRNASPVDIKRAVA